jgi:hypothetical protein
VKLIEDFRRTAAGMAPEAQQPYGAGVKGHASLFLLL